LAYAGFRGLVRGQSGIHCTEFHLLLIYFWQRFYATKLIFKILPPNKRQNPNTELIKAFGKTGAGNKGMQE
jgi:hypothetical protein